MKLPDKNTHEGTGSKENHFTVYGDMLLDVLRVVINNDIPFEIKSIHTIENSALLCIRQKRQGDNYAKVIENIEALLAEYRSYLELL